MVVALQGRMPGLAELRLLAEGIAGDGRFPVSPGWRADASVTGYRAGDRIAVTEEVFSRLVGVVLDQAKRNAG
jgi:hypothetical protein